MDENEIIIIKITNNDIIKIKRKDLSVLWGKLMGELYPSLITQVQQTPFVTVKDLTVGPPIYQWSTGTSVWGSQPQFTTTTTGSIVTTRI